MIYSSRRQGLVLAGTLGTLLLASWPAAAQQPAAPLPPGSPLIGRPDTPGAQKLAPVPAPPLAAAADKLPLDKLKAPKGFKVEVYASGMPNARSLALGDKGTVFVGSRLVDKVYAIVDKGGKREVKIVASGLYRPNGVAFKNGTLYIMELSQLSKIDNIEDHLDNPPKPTVILSGLPKEMYFTDNGRDWMSEDLPNDELNRMTKVGQHFGSPYCYQGNIPDQEFGWGHKCEEFVPPVALMGPHAASLGMRFYTGTMFPAEYRGAIFVARHGSWNRSNKFGGDIAVVKLNKDGSVKSVEPFITGFLVDNKYIGRPVDVQQMKDGSLLISDDYDGAVYRVTYGSPRTAAR